MVVLSFLLVIVAAITLIIGLFQDTLAWIWTSIASCVVAMIFLGIGVLQRRGRQPEELAGATAYGPGASGGGAGTGGGGGKVAEVSVVPKRTAADASAAVESSEGDLDTAADAARAAERASPAPGPEEETAERPISAGIASGAEATASDAAPPRKSAAAKRTAKKAPAKKAAARTTKKAATARTAKKAATGKRATKGTTGAKARAALADVKGLGPAKQEALLERFGSIEAIAAASKAELLEVRGIGERVADEIKSTLR